jgi:ribosomal protein L16 Arg81 hydroxylase
MLIIFKMVVMENFDYKFDDIEARTKHYADLLNTRPMPEEKISQALNSFDAFMARVPAAPPMNGDELT